MKKKIIFVCRMYLDQAFRSSTDIMTDNIIKGFIDNGYELTLIIIGNNNEKKMIINKYKQYAKTYFRQALIPKNTNNIKNLFYITRYNLLGIKLAQREINELKGYDPNDTILISHSPSIEAIYICKEILRHFDFHYIQCVSDPIALEGKLPETMGFKRSIFKLIERSTLKAADEVVYVTKSLMRFQSRLYPKYKDKMRFVNASYTPRPEPLPRKKEQNIVKIVYSGNYYSRIRNILPLYEAMKMLDDNYQLGIYGSTDLTLEDTRNVQVHDRIDSESIKNIENNADIIVCVLNTNCIQVPGKIFYNTDSDQRILIISDGPYGKQICSDLKTFHRFDFCENTPQSISKQITKIAGMKRIDNKRFKEFLSPKQMSRSIVLGDSNSESF